jgi:signal transduction histidine kinase
MRSLRALVLFGAVLWTAGLVLASMALVGYISFRYPDMPVLGRRGAIHTWFLHATPVALAAGIFMLAGFLQVRRGLTGIGQLRTRLGAVHDGREARLTGRYTAEVQPLVDDVNALLEQRERTVGRAVAKAGDLAHGLKTPLAVLSRDAERAQAAGQIDVAASIQQQVDRMRRQIDYHLAQARAAASGDAPGTRCAVVDSAEALARTLLRIHADRSVQIDVRVPEAHAVRANRVDVDEMLGNLLDNACTWARSRVVVSSAASDTAIVTTVDDDGAGLPAEMREAVLERGVRADERSPGSGLGLAIARDLAEVYGGSLALDASPLGGLRATLTLRRA